jgi:hypothetical protein
MLAGSAPAAEKPEPAEPDTSESDAAGDAETEAEGA